MKSYILSNKDLESIYNPQKVTILWHGYFLGKKLLAFFLLLLLLYLDSDFSNSLPYGTAWFSLL